MFKQLFRLDGASTLPRRREPVESMPWPDHDRAAISPHAHPLRNLLTLRFSLRAMLVVVTVGCLTLGWRANRYYGNRRVIDSLSQSGLDVLRADEPGKDSDLKLSFWTNVNIDQISISRSGRFQRQRPTIWKELSRLAPLRRFCLYGIDLPDQLPASEMNLLGGVSEAEFRVCRFPGKAFQHAMEQLRNLKSLEVSGSKFEGHDLAFLSSLTKLESLEVFDNSIPPDVIKLLPSKHLTFLKLWTISSDATIQLSAHDIEAISAMENLKELHLVSSPGLTIRDVNQLKQCRKLKVLTLELRNVTTSELDTVKADLAASMPNCEVNLYSESSP
jgi:hypothetical protein